MKTAIVTGGTSGIGLGVAKMLLEKGYYVYATYVGETFGDVIDNYEAIKVDQSSREELYEFIKYIKEKCGEVDCIICNAGMSIRKSFTETSIIERNHIDLFLGASDFYGFAARQIHHIVAVYVQENAPILSRLSLDNNGMCV